MNLTEMLSMGPLLGQLYARACQPVLSRYGVNQSAFDVLMFLSNNPEYNTARDVCAIRGLKKGIVSVTVENLIQSGYLSRRNDPQDRRIQRLELLEKASELVRDGRAAQESFRRAIFSDFSGAELRRLNDLLEKLVLHVQALSREMPDADAAARKTNEV